jgi:hypothetical protein
VYLQSVDRTRFARAQDFLVRSPVRLGAKNRDPFVVELEQIGRDLDACLEPDAE